MQKTRRKLNEVGSWEMKWNGLEWREIKQNGEKGNETVELIKKNDMEWR